MPYSKRVSPFLKSLLLIILGTLIVHATADTVPVITVEPKDSAVTEAQPVSFSVTATGDSLKYQWKKNDTTTLTGTGATTATYSISAVSGRDSGATFKCIVSNRSGSDTSRNAILLVKLNAPTISAQPVADTAYEGESGTFRVTATGSRLTYQWMKNGVNCTDTNANKARYYTPPTSLADNGASFKCVVTNSGGSVTSDSAFLYITKSPPVIVKQPVYDTVKVGDTAVFTISATSKYPPMTFQWQKRLPTDSVWSNITGAADSVYKTPPAAVADNRTQFRCLVSDSAGTRTSNSARLIVLFDIPVILADPQNVTAKVGDTATFKISVQGQGLTFRWQRDTTTATGIQTDSIYRRLVRLSDSAGGKFRCIVSNSGGSDTSAYATLTVKTPPLITLQPVSDTVKVGETVTFIVSATSKYPPKTYQWQKMLSTDSVYTNIASATDSAYTTPATTAADHASRFRCVVTDSGGSTNSNSARLYILFDPPVIVTHPKDTTVFVGDTVVFKVSATGMGLLFQWQRDTVNISGAGARDSIYRRVAALSDTSGRQYRCIVSNTGGSVASNYAKLTAKTAIIMDPALARLVRFSATPNVIHSNRPVQFIFNTAGNATVNLSIYNSLGKVIYSDAWVQTEKDLMVYRYEWDMRNNTGAVVSAGAYIAILKVAGTSMNKVEKTRFKIIK